MNWFSQSWLPTAIGAWSGPVNTALMRVDPSSIPIAVRPSMMAWLALVPMSLTLPGCLETLGETVLGLPADAIREACVAAMMILWMVLELVSPGFDSTRTGRAVGR